jgi:tRNA G18 (ribose-2'-O)-methylase SpoU
VSNTRRSQRRGVRGYFEVGVVGPKTSANVGTLWRSAFQLGAAGIYTVGHRYPEQPSDTTKAGRHIPLRSFADPSAFFAAIPAGAELVAVEMGGRLLSTFCHPKRAVYVLGAEDRGIPPDILARCQHVVSIESVRYESFNVAVAGSLVMYHRMQQEVVR